MGLAIFALAIVQLPLAMLISLGTVGAVVLIIVAGIMGALNFALSVVLWSIVYMLPILPVYVLGAIVRLILRVRQTDGWGQGVFGLATIAVMLLMVSTFFGHTRLDGVASVTAFASLGAFLLAYLLAFIAGVTGSARGIDADVSDGWR